MSIYLLLYTNLYVFDMKTSLKVRVMKMAIDQNGWMTPFEKLLEKHAVTAAYVPPIYKAAEYRKDTQDFIRALFWGC